MRIATTVGLLMSIVSASLAEPSSQPSIAPPSPAVRAFERFKSNAGEWEGRSSKGWTERLSIRPIAGGSCVMETSQIVNGPGGDASDADGMVTVYHMDGQHLMLTHYCMAKNQPRMRATEISDDGRRVVFTFLDGTNMPGRDAGHMDQAIFQFDGRDSMRQQWTFYANGKARFMEEIAYRRIGAATQPAR